MYCVHQEIKRGEESTNTVGGHGQKCMGSSEYSAKDNIKDDRSEAVLGYMTGHPAWEKMGNVSKHRWKTWLKGQILW